MTYIFTAISVMGNFPIAEIVDLYGLRGYNVIAITDHICERRNLIGRLTHNMNLSLTKENFSEYIDEISQQAERAWKLYQMRVLPGYEITKNSFRNHRSAHLLIIGTTQYVNPDLGIDAILKKAKKLGALTVAAHPFHTGELEFQTFYLWSRRHELSHLIDAWEVNARKMISSEVLNSGLPLIANSDFHHRAHFHSWKTKIDALPNQESLFQSIRQQKIDFFIDQY